MEEFTVKAREHIGTNSLDITIPAKLVKKLEIHAGTIFKITNLEENKKIKLIYELIS